MPKPLTQTGFNIDLTELIRSGVQLNKFDKNISFWKNVDGLQFTENSVKRKPGRELIFNFNTEPVRGLIALNEYETKIVYAGDLSNLYSYRLDTNTKNTVGTGYSLVKDAGSTVWDSGPTTWDSTLTVWDEGVVQSSRWSFTRFGTFVIGANNVGPMQIKKSNINFNSLQATKVSGATIHAGGSGYAVGNTIAHTGGAGSGFATKVVTVTGGAITSFEITNFGTGFANNNTLTQASTSGSGSGFQLKVTVPDCPFTRVRAVARQGPHILAINYSTATNDSPFDFAWCSADDPDTWVASATNSAGSLTIRESNTELKCIVPLGSGLAVYSEDQMFLINYTGAPFYFGYKVVTSSGIGAVSSNAVVSVGRKNYGLSRRGLFVTNGSTVEQIGVQEGIEAYIRENIAKTEYPQVSAYHNIKNDEVVWSLPINSAEPTEEIYYNYKTGAFGVRTGNISAFTESSVFDNAISGDTSGNIYFEGTGISAQTTTGETRAHDLGDANSIKELTSIRVGKRGLGNPVIQIGWGEDINDTPTYTDSFTVNETFKEEILRTAGRYLFLKVSANSPTDTWELTNMEVQGRTGGTR
jgi:hypothetical protein